MSTTVKQSSYRDIKRGYEKAINQTSDIYEIYNKTAYDEKGRGVEVDEEFEEEIQSQIDEIMPFLHKIKGRVEFIVDDTNTSEKKKAKYRDRLEQLNNCINCLEYIKEDIGVWE